MSLILIFKIQKFLNLYKYYTFIKPINNNFFLISNALFIQLQTQLARIYINISESLVNKINNKLIFNKVTNFNFNKIHQLNWFLSNNYKFYKKFRINILFYHFKHKSIKNDYGNNHLSEDFKKTYFLHQFFIFNHWEQLNQSKSLLIENTLPFTAIQYKPLKKRISSVLRFKVKISKVFKMEKKKKKQQRISKLFLKKLYFNNFFYFKQLKLKYLDYKFFFKFRRFKPYWSQLQYIRIGNPYLFLNNREKINKRYLTKWFVYSYNRFIKINKYRKMLKKKKSTLKFQYINLNLKTFKWTIKWKKKHKKLFKRKKILNTLYFNTIFFKNSYFLTNLLNFTSYVNMLKSRHKVHRFKKLFIITARHSKQLFLTKNIFKKNLLKRKTLKRVIFKRKFFKKIRPETRIFKKNYLIINIFKSFFKKKIIKKIIFNKKRFRNLYLMNSLPLGKINRSLIHLMKIMRVMKKKKKWKKKKKLIMKKLIPYFVYFSKIPFINKKILTRFKFKRTYFKLKRKIRRNRIRKLISFLTRRLLRIRHIRLFQKSLKKFKFKFKFKTKFKTKFKKKLGRKLKIKLGRKLKIKLVIRRKTKFKINLLKFKWKKNLLKFKFIKNFNTLMAMKFTRHRSNTYFNFKKLILINLKGKKLIFFNIRFLNNTYIRFYRQFSLSKFNPHYDYFNKNPFLINNEILTHKTFRIFTPIEFFTNHKNSFLTGISGFLYISRKMFFLSNSYRTKFKKHSFFEKYEMQKYIIRNFFKTTNVKKLYSLFNLNQINRNKLRLSWFKAEQLQYNTQLLSINKLDDSMQKTFFLKSFLLQSERLYHENQVHFGKKNNFFHYKDFFIKSLNVNIKRVRFKPGYIRIWKDARSLLQYALHLKFRYQHRLTKYLKRHFRFTSANWYILFEMGLLNILTQSQFLSSKNFIINFIKNGLVFVNGCECKNIFFQLYVNDFIQLIINLKYYIIFKLILNYSLKIKIKNKITIVKKLKTFKLDADKQKSKNFLKFNKFELNLNNDVSRFVEIDHFTLSIFIIYEPFLIRDFNNYNFCEIKYEIFNIYNWKYIN